MPGSRSSKKIFNVVSVAAVCLLSVIAIPIQSCRSRQSESVSTDPDDAPPRNGGAASSAARNGPGVPGFRDVARQSGIDFYMSFLQNETFKINLYDHGCGVAVADYDGDGDDDVLFLNQLGANALYRNRGNGTFENVTDEAGPLAMDDRIKVGAAFGDYDNDGDQDLYITSTRGGNALFKNLGPGRFVEVTDQAGVALVAHSQTPAFFDYDNDGDLDLFVTNTAKWTSNEFDKESRYYIGPRALWEYISSPDDLERNVLFRNDGGDHFTNVTEEAGLQGQGWGGDVAAFDFDEDGDLDLFVTNMFGRSQLYRNDGHGHFDDCTRDTLRRTSFGSIGCKAFDFDNDGRLDLFVTDMHSDMWMSPHEEVRIEPSKKYRFRYGPKAETVSRYLELEKREFELYGLTHDELLFGNSLFHNDGSGEFTEVSDLAGMETFWPWGVAVGDFDNDGYEDAFLPSGMGVTFIYWPSSLMHNNGDGTFTDVAMKEGIEPPAEGRYQPKPIGGERAARSSRSAATADFDGDGRLEVIVSNFNDRPYYFQNQFPNRHFVSFRLRGTTSNHDAIGAVVKLFIGSRILVRQVHATGGYQSQSSKTLHFGLGDDEAIDRAEIRWPSGNRQVIESPAVDHLHEITEPALP